MVTFLGLSFWNCNSMSGLNKCVVFKILFRSVSFSLEQSCTQNSNVQSRCKCHSPWVPGVGWPEAVWCPGLAGPTIISEALPSLLECQCFLGQGLKPAELDFSSVGTLKGLRKEKGWKDQKTSIAYKYLRALGGEKQLISFPLKKIHFIYSVIYPVSSA